MFSGTERGDSEEIPVRTIRRWGNRQFGNAYGRTFFGKERPVESRFGWDSFALPDIAIRVISTIPFVRVLSRRYLSVGCDAGQSPTLNAYEYLRSVTDSLPQAGRNDVHIYRIRIGAEFRGETGRKGSKSEGACNKDERCCGHCI